MPKLALVLQASRDAGRDVLLNVSQLEFIDSSGVALLLRARRDAQLVGSGFAVTRLQGDARRTFAVMGVLRVLPVRD